MSGLQIYLSATIPGLQSLQDQTERLLLLR